MLSEKQRQHLSTFGFLVVPQLFTCEEIETLASEFDRQAFPRPADESTDRGAVRFELLERNGHLGRIGEDERTAGIARNLLGSEAFYRQTTALVHGADEPWHAAMGWDVRIPAGRSDARENPACGAHYLRGFRLTIELDRIGAGCRRVIAGSHREPFHDQLWTLCPEISRAGGNPSLRQGLDALCDRDEIQGERRARLFADPAANGFELAPDHVPHMAVESAPGDMVILDHMLWHGCFGGSGPRRRIVIDWKEAPAEGR